jgi:predicted nucleic acid-binding Zn ribbon protein
MTETTIFRQVHCLWCGAELHHKATGRGREFCSAKCRVYYARALKRHAARCVDAALAGEPEPARDYGYPVEIAHYTVGEDGTVTKRSRSTRERSAA